MQNTDTLIKIMNSLIRKVNDNLPISPAEWIEGATRIEVLTDEIDNELAILEGKMAEEEVKLLESGMPATKAKALKVKCIDYTEYLKKKAFRARIEEFVKLAKKRAVIQD